MSRVKVCDNVQRNEQAFNLFIYLLLSYMSRAFFKLIFRVRCINSAVVLVSWAWCQRPGQDGVGESGVVCQEKCRFVVSVLAPI
jgi:hypothetical protein